MAQQMSDGHLARATYDLKRWDIPDHRRLKINLTALDKLHHGSRRDDLGHGEPQVVGRRRGRCGRLQVGDTITTRPEDAISFDDSYGEPDDVLSSNLLTYGGIDPS